MHTPFFYEENLSEDPLLILSEETSKHVAQVLRIKIGENIHLTNGKGEIHLAEIIDSNKKSTTTKIISRHKIPPPVHKITIAISPVKNTNRFEWFFEKATEIGVSRIIPLVCERTEKQYLKMDRIKKILISAMLQSKQAWLPDLYEPTQFSNLISTSEYDQKFIAHCEDDDKTMLQDYTSSSDAIILIGPEGDFTPQEIDAAIFNNFVPVSLGNNRLRTETAGIVAAVLLNRMPL
ncbi:16S rRNA (uracil(1498)-N(3))-methyltransferase [soil metagenome]